jgi:FlaA1/EpsC-like NDP-sugar epimerase
MKKSFLNLSRLVLENRPWLIGIVQALLVFCSLVLAWLLRFNFDLPYRHLLLWTAPILIVIRLVTLCIFNLNHGWWHFSGINDALRIVEAVVVGTLVFYFVMVLVGQTGFPRSVYVIEAVLTAGLLSGGRLVSRVLAESVWREVKTSKKAVLIGAGFAAQMVIREFTHSPKGAVIVGCVDDNKSKVGIRIHGVPVLGTVDQLPEITRDNCVDEILIAVPSATAGQMQRFIDLCDLADVPFRTVPALSEIIGGGVSLGEFRNVRLEDLLGREPVEIDLARIRGELDQKVVLITGAAGSIGSELCRQIAKYGPSCIICVDQSETGLFYLQQELASHPESLQLIFFVADINDDLRMQSLFKEYHPNCVFHAAAYKHVPMMEVNVQEAVKNNVLALLKLLGIASKSGCEAFLLISTDKAVNPTSVMGATKRVGELMLACHDANSMRCISVRFGNVLGSNGSVIPILRRQLEQNLPLTITHPEIRRFFMTTQEAVSLVLEASAVGEHGDILVLEMGKQVPIVQLAKSLIQLSGKREDQVSLRFTGLRPGEKLYEELYSDNEEVLPTDHPKLKRIRGKLMDWRLLAKHLDELHASLTVDGAEPILRKLRQIVPEYVPLSPDLSHEVESLRKTAETV